MLFLTVWKCSYNQSFYYFLFQIANLEQKVLDSNERLKSAEQQITEKQQHMDKLVSTAIISEHKLSFETAIGLAFPSSSGQTFISSYKLLVGRHSGL